MKLHLLVLFTVLLSFLVSGTEAQAYAPISIASVTPTSLAANGVSFFQFNVSSIASCSLVVVGIDRPASDLNLFLSEGSPYASQNALSAQCPAAARQCISASTNLAYFVQLGNINRTSTFYVALKSTLSNSATFRLTTSCGACSSNCLICTSPSQCVLCESESQLQNDGSCALVSNGLSDVGIFLISLAAIAVCSLIASALCCRFDWCPCHTQCARARQSCCDPDDGSVRIPSASGGNSNNNVSFKQMEMGTSSSA